MNSVDITDFNIVFSVSFQCEEEELITFFAYCYYFDFFIGIEFLKDKTGSKIVHV